MVKVWLYHRGLESGIIVTPLGDNDQSGLLYRLHHRETCASIAICAEREFWAILRSQSVLVDRLVSYPLVLRYRRCHRVFWGLGVIDA